MGFKSRPARAGRRGRFRVIAADPPWPFRDNGSRMSPDFAGHYQVQTLEDICAMGSLVELLVEEDAFLFLWAPNVLVLEGTATRVARAWGFEPIQLIPWVKTDKSGRPRLGGGHYTRVVTEQLILCRRGRAKVERHDVPGVIMAPRSAHSAKPDASYELIEKLCRGPYLELYARRRFSPKWSVWGNQVEEGAIAAAG